MCRASSTPKSKSFARGLQSTKPVANDRREFAIAIAKQNKIFKVCGFTYSLRQFFAPVFAQECQCYHRLVVTLLPTEREARSGSTRKSDSSKSKRDAQGVPFAFWWNRRELNPCPKTSWYNLLRGQSYLLEFPSASADRQAIALVALLCLIDTRAKSRFRCTTNLTHGGSRSPHPRYGRRLWPRHSLRCKSNIIVVV